jgi:hypothetical protein
LPIEPREQFIEKITAALDTLANNIRQKDDGYFQVNEVFTNEPRLLKLIVSNKLLHA